MVTHKTTVGVDSARLLIIDPLYLRGLDLPDKLADLPEADPLTGFVKFGPSGLGLIVSPTGKGDGQYDVEVETFEDPVGYTRVARLTVTFAAALMQDEQAQGFKGWLPDELRTAEARRLDDLEDRLRRLEAWVTKGETGLPIYPEEVTDQEAGKKQKTAVVDHEDRLRRLEVWVAATEFTNKEGESYYPYADVVKPWADPEEVARLMKSDDHEGLSRLIFGDDPFVGLPEEAVPAAAAAAMRARQEARLADDDDDSPFVLEEPEWLKEAGDRPVDQGYNLVIWQDNTAMLEVPCAICGTPTDFEPGPGLFLEGTDKLVCQECGRKHAPALAALLALGRLVLEEVGRPVGGTHVILADVDRAYNMAAEGLVALKEAIVGHIEAGCQVPVAARLFNALGKTDEAFGTLKQAFGILYSGPGRDRRDIPDEEIPF